jgi:hypothetical protein
VFRFFRRPAAPPLPWNTEMLVLGEKDGAFAAVRNSRVLIYWPHGFGDFVHLSYVIPLLEPSNEYFVTRFGDDFVHLYDVGDRITPIYSGETSIGNGTSLGVQPHFGLDMDKIENRVERIEIPDPLRSRISDAKIDLMLFTRYPEMTGRTPYPFHTKARFLASNLVDPKRLAQFDLSQPLRSSLAFRAPVDAVARVEARLRDVIAPGEHLYMLSPGGHTQLRKVFPEEEVVAFAREIRRRDPRARVITIDERTSEALGRERDLAPTTTDLFADLGVPFAHVLLTLVHASHAYAGVASGPLHTALSIGGRPVVGIWLGHWPEYYDEPSPGAIHLVGPLVYREKLDRRPGARTKAAAGVLPYTIVPFRKRPPNAFDVIEAFAAF